jgi:Protein of unknown function (DUF2874).
MKTKLLLFALLLSAFTLYSCNDDDDNLKNVDKGLLEAFNEKYPGAKVWEWEMENGYFVAFFLLDGHEAEAWFDRNHKWVFTEIDLRFNELPEAVQTGFNTSEYADWRIDDVDQFDYADAETRYIIEVEKGNREMKLAYHADGTLVN